MFAQCEYQHVIFPFVVLKLNIDLNLTYFSQVAVKSVVSVSEGIFPA